MLSPIKNKSAAKIIIADDHPIILQGLKSLLEGDERYEIIAECTDGQKLLQVASQAPVDLIICDLSMPKMNGLDAIREIRKIKPDVKVLVLTMHKEMQIFEKAMSLGVEGYVLKEDIYDQLKFAVQAVLAGHKSFSPKITESLATSKAERSDLAAEILTRREREILRLAAQGRSNKDIADELDISVRTVETHRGNLMSKLDLRNVQELVAFALQQGIVTVDDISG